MTMAVLRIQQFTVMIMLMISVSTTFGEDLQENAAKDIESVKDAKPVGQTRQGTVNDFLGQLGALASQGTVSGNGPAGYLQGVLQQYYQQNQQNLYRPPYRPYPQSPLPYPADSLQDLQYGQKPVLSQTPGGGFGLRPGVRPGAMKYPPYYPGPRPPLAPSPSFVGALQSVARHDDARCVPRLLCEVTAGGTPGSSRDIALPFVNRDTLLSLLTVLNFGTDSPLLVFGRAALLGYMAQGDPATCLSAYPTCPRDPDLLVDYLNNHNGGFFRFFNPGSVNQNFPQQQQYLQQQYLQQQYLQQQYLQNQLGRPGQHYAPNYRDNNHYAAGEKHGDIQSRILINVHPNENPGSLTSQSFFPNQNTYSQRPSFSRNEGLNFNKGTRAGRKYNFKFPVKEQSISDTGSKPTQFKFGEPDESQERPQPGPNEEFLFQGQAIGQQLLEPSENGDLPTFTLDDGEYTFVNPYTQTVNNNGDMVKTFSFPHIRVGSPTEISESTGTGSNNEPSSYTPLFQKKPLAPMSFPDKTGTGDLRLDFDQSFLSPSGNPYAEYAPPVTSVSSSIFREDQTENRPSTNSFRKGNRLRFPKDDDDRRY